MTASLRTKRNKVYVVLYWKHDGERMFKWVPTDLPIKYGKRAGDAEKQRVLKEWEPKIIKDKNFKDMTFGEFLRLWVEYQKQFIKETTYNEYRRMIFNTISPYFDERGITLQMCGVAEIEDFYSYIPVLFDDLWEEFGVAA